MNVDSATSKLGCEGLIEIHCAGCLPDFGLED
jgi:hypothetical protein